MDGKKVPKGKKARYVVISLTVILIALFVLLRFNPARATNTAMETTGTVVSLNVTKTAESSSSLEAQPSATVLWSTSGGVEEVYVKAGDQVKAVSWRWYIDQRWGIVSPPINYRLLCRFDWVERSLSLRKKPVHESSTSRGHHICNSDLCIGRYAYS